MQLDAVGRRGERHRAPNLGALNAAAAPTELVAERDAVAVCLARATAETDAPRSAAPGVGDAAALEGARGQLADANLLGLAIPVDVGREAGAVGLLERHAGALAAHPLAEVRRAGLQAAGLAAHIGHTERSRRAGSGRSGVTAGANLNCDRNRFTGSRLTGHQRRRIGLETARQTGEQRRRAERTEQPHGASAQGRCCRP